MNIRTMRIGDYDEVYALWMSCAGMGLNYMDDSREGIDRFLKRNPNTCFVAEIENKVIRVIIAGDDFWGKQGFTVREDLVYRNKSIKEMIRIDI